MFAAALLAVFTTGAVALFDPSVLQGGDVREVEVRSIDRMQFMRAKQSL